ncbi:flavoprotein-like protein [Zopfochytrium polystomum]|nr:flavoprotein-like protein [Zopfochytrium polystomum]
MAPPASVLLLFHLIVVGIALALPDVGDGGLGGVGGDHHHRIHVVDPFAVLPPPDPPTTTTTAADRPLTVALVIGSSRPHRLGLRVAKFVRAALAAANHTVVLVDPVEHPLPFLEEKYEDLKRSGREYPKSLDALHAIFTASDAAVIVSPEYNSGLSPPLANMLNYYWLETFLGRAAAVATYSPSSMGGARAAVALRPYLATLGLVSVPEALRVPWADRVLDEDGALVEPDDGAGGLGEGVVEEVRENAREMVRQVGWFGRALRAEREREARADGGA